MTAVQAYVAVAKLATLLFGGAVTTVAARAYLRTGSPALRALALGLGLVTLGTLLAGVGHQLLGRSFVASVAIQSTFTALGFAVLAYSLYATMESDEQERDRPATDGY